MEKKFDIGGMTCAACSAGIQKTVGKMKGVRSAEVSLMGECMRVEFDENTVGVQDIIETVTALGYEANPTETARESTETNFVGKHPVDEAKRLRNRFLASLIFLLPLLYFTMAHMLVKAPLPAFATPAINFALIQLILTTPVLFINFAFFSSGIKAALKRVPNRDTLVSIGAAASYLYSVVIMFVIGNQMNIGDLSTAHKWAMDGLFFESTAMILTLVTLGKWLEARSKKKTDEEIEKLLKLAPDTVSVERGGEQIRISIKELKVGDTVVIKQGDSVPVDGVVLSGSSFLDKSAITGESLPVEVTEGDFVTTASVNKGNVLKVRAEKIGEDTVLSKIIKLVRSAGTSKAPIERTVDKIAGVFVPIVMLIAGITLIAWIIIGAVGGNVLISRALNMAISVLVISCPCALGLATPVAVMAATGRGAALGILYKDAEVLQKARNVKIVLLDKTATITEGKPRVTDVIVFRDTEENYILELFGGIELNSNHPLATCVVEYAQEKQLPLRPSENFVYYTGMGGESTVNGQRCRIGNRRFMVEHNVDITETEEAVEWLSQAGKTVLYCAIERNVVGLIGVADTLKKGSKEAVARLKECGMIPVMLTGDSAAAAQAIAEEVGIERVYSEVLPEDKLNVVIENQKTGLTAMVGDGINDSPALKQADVGIAMGNGTDVAIDSADIVLVNGDLRAVHSAIGLSRVTVRNIKENLFWAFIYNILGIPIAAGVLSFIGIILNPMIGALAMSLSSVFVVGNALRLTAYRPKTKSENHKKGVEKFMKKTLVIDGMSCSHCSARVEKALNAIEGVQATVNLKKKIAEVESEVDDSRLIQAVEEAGYTVKKVK